LRHDRFRQALRHKPAVALLNHLKDQISHTHCSSLL
jgi:hypothetical protein